MSESENQKLKHKLKEIAKYTLKYSTTHAISNIARNSNTVVRVIWAVFFATSFGFCSLFVSEKIIAYFKYDVVTEIRILNDFPAIFPTVSICNNNAFVTDFSLKFLKEIGVQNNLADIFDDQVYNNLSLEAKDSLKQTYFMIGSGKVFESNETFKRLMGYNLTETILFCQISHKACNLSSDFKWFWHQIYGNCFSFNAYGNQKTIWGLNSSPLRIDLFAGVPTKLQRVSFGNQLGMIIFVHNSSQTPLSINGIGIRKHTLSDIAVSREFSNLLSYPYSNCDFNLKSSSKSEYLRLLLATGYRYTQQECTWVCVEAVVAQGCNCSFTFLPSYFENLPRCLTLKQQFCSFIYASRAKEPKYIQENCLPFCPLECDMISFSFSISEQEYPTYPVESSYMKSNKVYSNQTYSGSFGSNIAAVSIYYDRLEYTSLSESPSLSLVELMSNFAGIAGLFLGMSVLSMVEFLELGLELCFCIIESLRKKRKVEKST